MRVTDVSTEPLTHCVFILSITLFSLSFFLGQLLGPDHPEVATDLSNLAEVLQDNGEHTCTADQLCLESAMESGRIGAIHRRAIIQSPWTRAAYTHPERLPRPRFRF